MPQLARSESASAGSGFSWNPWMRPSSSVIATPNWRGVVDPLRRQRRDRAPLDVGLVCGPHGAQVDVGERVAGDDQERIGLGEEVADLAHPARGAERLGLLAVGDLEPEVRAVAEYAPDLLGQVGDVGDDLPEAVRGEQLARSRRRSAG